MSNVITPCHWIMDIETISDCFIACFEHYKEDIQISFVINRKRNDFNDLIRFLKGNISQNQWHISFNGLSFDAQVIQWILDSEDRLSKLNAPELSAEIAKYAEHVIACTKTTGFAPIAPWHMKIKQIDLFKMNHWDNPAKSSSLKWVQYSMDWYNVEEMPIHHTESIDTDEKLNLVLNYCWNDVKSTKEIFNYSKEQIQLRKSLTEEYGINLYSASEPRISKELFGLFLSKKMDIPIRDLKKMRTPRYNVYGKDIILPYTQFKTYEFKALHDWVMGLDIDFHTKMTKDERDAKYKFSVDYKGVKTDYGLGGLHGARNPGVYEATPGMTIMTSDVISFYPNLAIRNKWSPAHIPKEIFCEQYEWFFDERKKIPKSDPRNYVYKIILNSTYGLSKDANSFLYDPLFTMKITINGQLSLSMLYEMLAEGIPGAIPLMQNTDGLEMMIPTHFIPKYMEICKKWEKITSLELEHDEYQKMIIGDVNNYIAVSKSGKVKSKGRFEWEDQDKKKVAYFHKNKSFLVIPKAIHEYFINGVKPEDYLESNKNIFDYCGGAKAKGDWRFEERSTKGGDYKVAPLHKIVRYYISKDGIKMMKVNQKDKREAQVEAGLWKQVTCNNMTNKDSKSFEEYNVDKAYYLEAIYKEINNIDKEKEQVNVQLEMF